MDDDHAELDLKKYCIFDNSVTDVLFNLSITTAEFGEVSDIGLYVAFFKWINLSNAPVSTTPIGFKIKVFDD